MSPLWLRRFRAERLLRRDFEQLRVKVLRTVRARLAAGGVDLDIADLEACYGQAWQGLYMAILDGQEIANPDGWLVVVTLRRAFEEQRSRQPRARAGEIEVEDCAVEPDMAARMDELSELRHVFESLRRRLRGRERQAATLCYLQGLSRAEAAELIGVSARRMRKLMEGDGAARQGVAGKVAELVDVVRAGSWCEERGSTMRALAFGVLDPQGERYRLAVAHQRECPACRRYVLSLRGLAAVLPPLGLPGGLGLGAGAGAGAGAGVSAGAGAGGGAAVGGGTGALPSVAGALSAKLAGGLAAVGVAAGGVVLVAHTGRSSPARSRPAASVSRARAARSGGGPWPGGALQSAVGGYAVRARRRMGVSRSGGGGFRSNLMHNGPPHSQPPAAGGSVGQQPPRSSRDGRERAEVEFGFERLPSRFSQRSTPAARDAPTGSPAGPNTATASAAASTATPTRSGAPASTVSPGFEGSASSQQPEVRQAGPSAGVGGGRAGNGTSSGAHSREEFSFE